MTQPPLPAAVDIREVAPRDGLQIEAPAFVSPRAVPSMADAADVAAAHSEVARAAARVAQDDVGPPSESNVLRAGGRRQPRSRTEVPA